jgi:hypothetical protein
MTEEHGWLVPLDDELAKTADVSFDGLGGDILSDIGPEDPWLTPSDAALFETGQLDELSGNILRLLGLSEAAMPVPRRLFGLDLSYDSARARLQRELTRHTNAPFPMASFYFWNRTRKEIALQPFAMLNPVPMVHTPFLDLHLYDFLASIPAELQLSHRIHTETIRRYYPRFAHLPFNNEIGKGARPEIRRRGFDSLAGSLTSRFESSRFSRTYEDAGAIDMLTSSVKGQPSWASAVPNHWAAYLRTLSALTDPHNAARALHETSATQSGRMSMKVETPVPA